MKTNKFTLAASYLKTEADARTAAKVIVERAEAGDSLDDIAEDFPGIFEKVFRNSDD